MNATFWRHYYQQQRTLEPSPFAFWADEQWIAPQSTIVDLGCGNGRDSFYFASLGHQVLGVDAHVRPKDAKHCQFFLSDLRTYCAMPSCGFDIAYCRFVLHAVDADTQLQTLRWASRCLPPWGLLLIECRSALGEPPDDGKPRRLIDAGELVDQLLDVGLQLKYIAQGRGFAPTETEDPICIRIVATK